MPRRIGQRVNYKGKALTMTSTLTLSTLPEFDSEGWMRVSDDPPVKIHDGPPRVASVRSIELAVMFHATSQAVFGAGANTMIADLAGISHRTPRDWYRRQQIPPPMIVGMVAHLNYLKLPDLTLQLAAALSQCPDPIQRRTAELISRRFSE